MRGRRLWFKVEAHGGLTPVYVQKAPLIAPDGEPCDAYYERDAPRIVVEQKDNVTLMKQKLFHELKHLATDSHTGDAREHAFIGKTSEERAQHEERVVGFQEVPEFDILTRNGWLKFPNPPKVK